MGLHTRTFGFGVIEEDFEAIDEIGAVERVTADADAQRLPKPDFGCLVDGLIGQGAGTRDDANFSLRVNVARHDADLALARLDDSRTIWPNQPRLVLANETMLHFDHVQLRNALGDADNEGNFRV